MTSATTMASHETGGSSIPITDSSDIEIGPLSAHFSDLLKCSPSNFSVIERFMKQEHNDEGNFSLEQDVDMKEEMEDLWEQALRNLKRELKTEDEEFGCNSIYSTSTDYDDAKSEISSIASNYEDAQACEDCENEAAEGESGNRTERIRNYQAALCKMAEQRNIIACLPTGSGKTLIAMKLMNYFKNEVTNGKRIFFIAPTVPLLKQQAETIAKCTNFKVKIIHGGNRNQWKNWTATFKSFEVFVIIPSILLLLLDHAFITLKDMALLVIDECHHALKANSVNLIMKRYVEIYEKGNGKAELPRVLGLTATIVKKNIKEHSIETTIKQIEKRLCCTAVTFEKFDEVQRYSTHAQLIIKNFEITSQESKDCFMIKLKEPLGLFVQQMMRLTIACDKNSKVNLIVALKHLKNQQEEFKDIINSINDVEQAFCEIGRFGAMFTAGIKHQYFSSCQLQYIPEVWKQYLLTNLRTLMFSAYSVHNRIESEADYTSNLSSKVSEVLKILSEYRTNGVQLCGIIFVKRRCEAIALGAVLDDISEKFPENWAFLKPAVVVGTNDRSCAPPKYRQTVRRQEEILVEFRKGLVNLIVATDILQEGIDVQSCSLVIRFDKIQSYPSFIQSMGRARKDGAKFFVLIPTGEVNLAGELLYYYNKMKLKINATLQEQASSLKGPLTEDLSNKNIEEDQQEKMIEFLDKIDFCPGGDGTARITMFSSIQIVNMYCSVISHQENQENNTCTDKFKNLQLPLSIEKRMEVGKSVTDPENDRYKSFVRLPSNAAVKEIISGPIMVGRENAKRAAYLEVCKKLYDAGALNGNLLPLRTS